MKKKTYLITGCAGFIGSHLVKKLFRNHKLILVDDLSGGSIINLPKVLRKKLIKKKIQDLPKLKIKKLDGIFHLAAQASVPFSLKNFFKSSSNNLASSLKVFEFSRLYSAPVVFASSCAVYGNLPFGSDKKNKFSITSPYAQDKLALENYAKMSFEVFGTSSVGLRLYNVYGPGQPANNPYSSVIPIFIYRIIKKLPVTINGGFQTRDFIYVEDVVDVMAKSMVKIKKLRYFNVFNLGTGRSIKIEKLLNTIKKTLNINPKIIRRRLEKFDPKKSTGSYKKIFKFLNLKNHKFTTLKNGLEKTIGSIKR